MKSYKVNEVAEILQSCPETVKNEIKKNRLKAFKVGSEWRISEKALEDYMGVIANNYKTEKEVELEKENEYLRNQLSLIQDKLLKINSVLIGA